jgi:hypothetical protein
MLKANDITISLHFKQTIWKCSAYNKQDIVQSIFKLGYDVTWSSKLHKRDEIDTAHTIWNWDPVVQNSQCCLSQTLQTVFFQESRNISSFKLNVQIRQQIKYIYLPRLDVMESTESLRSWVSTATRLMARRPRNWGSTSGKIKSFFFSPQSPDHLWRPPRLLYKGCRWLFPRAYSGRGVKLTTHLYRVPK